MTLGPSTCSWSSSRLLYHISYEAKLVLGGDFGDDDAGIFGIGDGGDRTDGLLKPTLFLKMLHRPATVQ